MKMFQTNVRAAMAVLALVLQTAGCQVAGEESSPELDEVYTMPSGLTFRILARGNLEGDASIEVKWRGETAEMEAQDGATLDFVTVELTVAPGGHTGWHSHPGHVFATVVQGTATIYHAEHPCEGEDFSAGQALIENSGQVEIARNHGTSNLVVMGTFVVPQGSGFRIDQPAPPGAEECP